MDSFLNGSDSLHELYLVPLRLLLLPLIMTIAYTVAMLPFFLVFVILMKLGVGG